MTTTDDGNGRAAAVTVVETHGGPVLGEAIPNASSRVDEVAVIGLGYVGLTLAVSFANSGARVVGYDAQQSVTATLARGVTQIQEPDVQAGLVRALGAGTITISSSLPRRLPSTVVVCVSTPIDDQTKEPDLSQLLPAIDALTTRIDQDTLVVLRSTVPVGTTRQVLLARLVDAGVAPLVVFAPERTIQGQALEEIRRLPQVVGGVTPEATRRAVALFSRLCRRVVPVSCPEAAEMVKLVCNAHTDLIYGYGNEVALMAEALNLDADEIIASANFEYPRPDLCRPGFVGGSCLTKDPYLLSYALRGTGYAPEMVLASRRLNERVPVQAAERVLTALRASRASIADCTVLVAGVAYKGRPETDDTRGAPSRVVVDRLAREVGLLRGHDYVVPPDRIAAMGLEPVTLAQGARGADAILFLNDHARYLAEDVMSLVRTMRAPAVVYDAWGMFGDRLASGPGTGLRYLRLGHA